jgi:broad specificity phosphatase PhoE
MPPIIHCVRHAQGVHNLTGTGNYNIRDPVLTPFGEQQCSAFAATFPYHDQIELIVTSPLRRAISTALLSFAPEIERSVKVVAMSELQEVGDMPCDSGSELNAIRQECKESPVDFSLVEEGWEKKEGMASNTVTAIQRRADAARKWLKSRPEKGIAVISHGCFLHFLTDDWVDSQSVAGMATPL